MKRIKECTYSIRPLPDRVRGRIQAKLKKAAELMEEAVSLAHANGWPEAFGFAEGGGWNRMGLHIIPSMEVRDAHNGSPPAEYHVSSPKPPEDWDAGAW